MHTVGVEIDQKMLNFQVLVTVCLLFFLYSTRYNLPFIDSINWVQATDVYSYLVISSSAPNLPTESISFHFAQRWMPHYLVGCVAALLDIELGLAYGLISGVIVASLLVLAWSILLQVARDQTLGILIFLLLALSVFSFRLYIFVPGLFADLVFVLGLAVALKACLVRSYGMVLVGMLVATTGKQLSLLVLPGLALYIYVVWGAQMGRAKAFFMGVLLTLVVIAFYQLLIYTSADFALPNSISSNVLFDFFPWAVSDRFTLGLLSEHVFRILLPLLPFILVWGMAPGVLTQKLHVLSAGELLAWMLMILGPMAYAFFPGPEVQMGNQSRYVGSVMLPLAILVLKTLPDVKLRLRLADYAVLATVLLVLSYHHRYTMLQATPVAFLAAQLMGMGALACWMIIRKTAVFSQLTRQPLLGGR
jgi:hypothetical protein